MQTDGTPNLSGFQDPGSRKVVARFDAGQSVPMPADCCFLDYRNQRFVEHSVQELVSQKVMGLCLGYEDVVDHDILRFDQLFATLCGREANEVGQTRCVSAKM